MIHPLHIICERDAGLFSLIQQVIANIPWANRKGRIPVVFFGGKTCYWTPEGYADRNSVWEYYFEPLVEGVAVADIPPVIIEKISNKHPPSSSPGYFVQGQTFASSHFGNHQALKGLALNIPYLLKDPNAVLRDRTQRIIEKFVRPRAYIQEKVERFIAEKFGDGPVIGVHVRGTDAISDQEKSGLRKDSLNLLSYMKEIEKLIQRWPSAKVLVATDAQSSLRWLRTYLGEKVISYASILHEEGEAAGKGPTGGLMPAYIAGDRMRAAQNGEEAVIEYLLLTKCNHLIHNGSNLARTALLHSPNLVHTNVHPRANHEVRFLPKSRKAIPITGRG